MDILKEVAVLCISHLRSNCCLCAALQRFEQRIEIVNDDVIFVVAVEIDFAVSG